MDKTYNLVATPAHGQLSFAPDGTFEYTPDAGFSGIDTFTYDCNYTYIYPQWAQDSNAYLPAEPATGTTSVATEEIWVAGPVVELDVAGEVTANGVKEAPLQVNNSAAGTRYGMPLAGYQQGSDPASSDPTVEQATVTITNPYPKTYSGFLTLSWTRARFAFISIRSARIRNCAPLLRCRSRLAWDNRRHSTSCFKARRPGPPRSSPRCPTRRTDWHGKIPIRARLLHQRSRPARLQTRSRLDVVGPNLRFQSMYVGEEAAGQVGFVKLDDNNPSSPQVTRDPEWATATLEIPVAGHMSCQWELSIPAGISVWQEVGGKWVTVASNTEFSGPVPGNFWIEGTQVASGQLKVEAHYSGNGIDVTYSSSVDLQVVSDSLVVGGVTPQQMADGGSPAAVPIDAGYELGKKLPAAPGGVPAPVPDNGMLDGLPVNVPPGIGTSEDPQDVDDALVQATFDYNLGGAQGQFWIEVDDGSSPADAVSIWTNFGKGTYFAVPTSPGQALAISGSGSVDLLIQGIDPAAMYTQLTIDVHLVPLVSRYAATSTVASPTTSHGDAVASAPILVGGADPVQVFASEAYASANDPGHSGEFVISRGEGNTSDWETVPFCIETNSSDLADAAQLGTDYTLMGEDLGATIASDGNLYGTVSIPDGASSVTLQVCPAETDDAGWDKVVKITLNEISPDSSFDSVYLDPPDDSSAPNQTATVTILNGNGATPLVNLNADTVSTGQSPQTVGDWLVSAGVRDGSVQLVPTIGTSDFSPVYVGDDSIYPIIACEVQMPDDVTSATSLKAQLYFADLAASQRELRSEPSRSRCEQLARRYAGARHLRLPGQRVGPAHGRVSLHDRLHGDDRRQDANPHDPRQHGGRQSHRPGGGQRLGQRLVGAGAGPDRDERRAARRRRLGHRGQ